MLPTSRAGKTVVAGWLITLLFMLIPVRSGAEKAHEAFLVPSENPELNVALEEMAIAAGWRVSPLPWQDFRPGFENQAGDDQAIELSLLMLADAARLPDSAVKAVTDYLNRGGNVLALNTPAFREILVSWNDRWGTVSELIARMNDTLPPTIEIPITAHELTGWKRECRDMTLPATYQIIQTEKGMALDVRIPRLDGWDSLRRTGSSSPVFPPETTAVAFEARSTGNSEQLALECQEADGSRWIAVVNLEPDWKPSLLLPENFRLWESVPARAGTILNFQQVISLAVTQATTHTGAETVNLGYQIRAIRGLHLQPRETALLQTLHPPELEGLCPQYKYYPCSKVDHLSTAGGFQGLTAPPVPDLVTAHHPRPSPAAFDKHRSWSSESLLEAWGDDGSFRGSLARLVVSAPADKPVPGFAQGRCMILSFSVSDLHWYTLPESRALLRRSLERLRLQAALLDGGLSRYATLPGEPIDAGVTVALLDERPHQIAARVDVLAPDGYLLDHMQWNEMGTGTLRLARTWRPAPDGPDEMRVRVKVSVDGHPLPEVGHELAVWRRPDTPRFVEIRDGTFRIDGKRWRPHGINYMPSSGVGVEDRHFFEYWLSAQSYDPIIIQRDLERCRNMGLNAVSVFLYYQDLNAMNLLDFLRRARALGMRANVSLRPGTPMELDRDKIGEHILRAHQEPWRGFGDTPLPRSFAEMVSRMIARLDLGANDTVFAYDLAWEPQFRDYEREPFNRDYEQWLVDQYGSLENAEADWGCPVPRDGDGRVVGYLPAMLTDSSGKSAPAMAAYRRFLDRLLYEKYAAVRDAVREVAPHQHVSFRMSMAGDPTNRDPNTILYDFAYLAGAVDILEPEGYGRLGSWENVKPGRFTRSYAQWANPMIPMIWAEAGIHVWDGRHNGTTARSLARQATFYQDFYRMMIESGAEGIFWWWYPGGYRVNENSDYGVINPDGTDRPVTAVIRAYTEPFQQGPSACSPDTWLTFNRDAHPWGLTGIYDALRETYWQLIDAGKCPGLNTEGTGTTSADCPALAVGIRPWTGKNPPEFLDAHFNRMLVSRLEQEAGTASEPMPARGILNGPHSARSVTLVLTSLGEAMLLGGPDWTGKTGEVYLRVQAGHQTLEIPLPKSLPRFASATISFTLPALQAGETVEARMQVRGRGPFGPVIRWQAE